MSGPRASGLLLLVVDGDDQRARATRRLLIAHGAEVVISDDGAAGLSAARRGGFDLVLAEFHLPDLDGVAWCRALRRQSDVPVILVGVRAEEDRIRALDAGADDCVARPVGARELWARVQARVRRARGLCGPRTGVVRVGELAIDLRAMRATVSGRDVPLTGYELNLLHALAERAGRVISREQLLELAKGSADDAFDRSIDGHISRLRTKLGDDPKRPRLLKTVRGAGYLLSDDI
ncbi:MAG TPA: response regulator transcription factor [Polyangia bacterium]|nr:response regulator transcription factor [Polyangia bacterium]